jgi:hypothetical protein
MKNNRQIIFIITLLFLLSSCVIPAHQGINNENQNTSNLPFASTQTIDTDRIIILTPTPTSTIGLPKIEYTSTPFQTAKQPITYDDLNLYIKEISENNNNCQLPCIWGVTHGDQIKDRFLTFVNKYESSGEDLSYYYETGVTENIYWLYAGLWINDHLLNADFHQKKENESEFLSLRVHSYDTEYEDFWNTNDKSELTYYFSYYL